MWRHEHKYIYISVAVRTLVLSYIGREGDGQSQDKQAAQITCTCVQSTQWAGAVCILQVMLVPCAFRTCSGSVCSLRSQGVRVIIDFKPIRYPRTSKYPVRATLATDLGVFTRIGFLVNLFGFVSLPCPPHHPPVSTTRVALPCFSFCHIVEACTPGGVVVCMLQLCQLY